MKLWILALGWVLADSQSGHRNFQQEAEEAIEKKSSKGYISPAVPEKFAEESKSDTKAKELRKQHEALLSKKPGEMTPEEYEKFKELQKQIASLPNKGEEAKKLEAELKEKQTAHLGVINERYNKAIKKNGKVLGFKARIDEKGNLAIDPNNPISSEKDLPNNGITFWRHTDGKYYPWLKGDDGKWAGAVSGGTFSKSAIDPNSKDNGSFQINGKTGIQLNQKIPLSPVGQQANNQVFSVLNNNLILMTNSRGNVYGPLDQVQRATNVNVKGIPFTGNQSTSSGYKIQPVSPVRKQYQAQKTVPTTPKTQNFLLNQLGNTGSSGGGSGCVGGS